MEWNLKGLFENEEKFYLEIERINTSIEEILKFKDIDFDSETLLKILNLKWQTKKKVNDILIYGSLNYYKDIESEETKKMKKVAEQLVIKVDSSFGFIDEEIIKLGEDTINDYLLLNKNLKAYEFYLKNVLRLQNHLQSDTINSKIENLKNAINHNLTEYNDAVHGVNLGIIMINDKKIELNQTNVTEYLSSHDRETRKQTYLCINEAYQDKSELFAKILDSIFSKRVEISNLEGYSSVSERSLFKENINPIILEKVITSVRKNNHLIRDYLKLKTSSLSINNPHMYDYSVPFDNENKRIYPLEEAIEIIKSSLKPLGKDYLEIVELLLSNQYIDTALDKKKHQSITFSWGTYSFMNYRESYTDLKRLIHEIGHIVNAYLSKQQQPFIYEESTVFIGETASLVNEILLNRYLYQNAETKEEKLFYLSNNIENYFTQIFRQTMYTEFENILYQNSKKGTELSSYLLNNEYLKLLEKYYGKETIYDDCTKVEWSRIGHLYRWDYYVSKYATGLIIASAIVNKIIDEKTISTKKYLDFLSSGSNDYSLNILEKIGIDLTNEKIMDTSFNVLKNEINEFKKILTEK